MTPKTPTGETEARVLAAVQADRTAHGPIVRATCSSVWTFGIRFADGYRNRYALPKDSAEFRAATGAEGLEAARKWVRSRCAN